MGRGRAMFKYIDCIDATTDYCPCSLAEGGECLICTQLKDNNFCDCVNYGGTCIYQEYIWNNEKSKRTRRFKICDIKNKRLIRDDIVLYDIKVNYELLTELNNIGAFVFLRKPGEDEHSSIPISVISCDMYKNEITVAIKIIGVKTKLISQCEDYILVKGPYWNGIQGQRFLKKLKDQNLLILGRGIALAPAIMAANKITNKNNNIYALLEKGRSKENYFKDYFSALNCTTESICFLKDNNSLKDESKKLIIKYIEDYKIETILSAGNDKFHRIIIEFINSYDNRINFATVNNATMCCGEGQCGSCIINDSSGKKIRGCKEQYNPIEVFLGMGEHE